MALNSSTDGVMRMGCTTFWHSSFAAGESSSILSFTAKSNSAFNSSTYRVCDA